MRETRARDLRTCVAAKLQEKQKNCFSLIPAPSLLAREGGAAAGASANAPQLWNVALLLHPDPGMHTLAHGSRPIVTNLGDERKLQIFRQKKKKKEKTKNEERKIPDNR